MKNSTLIIHLFIFILLTGSCRHGATQVKSEPYAFFVAGHTYGKPGTDSLGFYPLFRNEFDSIRAWPHIAFGVLTGDIVQYGYHEYWDAVDKEIVELGLPVYFAPGNHDTYMFEIYRQRYGDPANDYRTNGSFKKQNDLFILLDANLENWSILGDQLQFLKDELDENKSKVRHVFIFMHQLIWWNEHNVFRNTMHNWLPYTPDTTNYWGTLEPLFQDYPAPVYLFAGDLGATPTATPYLYYKQGNISYIASGMGNGDNDNYLFVTVDENGAVHFDLIALQGERNRFGKLEDFKLP